MIAEKNDEFTETSDYVISEIELEKIESKLLNSLKNQYESLLLVLDSETERAAYCVIRGHYKGWNLSKTIKYYSLEHSLAASVWKSFNFKIKEGGQIMSRTKTKQNNIVTYLEQNVGQVVTPTKVSTDVSISLPTFYNLYNANRQFFKKVKRGQFEIVNPKEQRESELSS